MTFLRVLKVYKYFISTPRYFGCTNIVYKVSFMKLDILYYIYSSEYQPFLHMHVSCVNKNKIK